MGRPGPRFDFAPVLQFVELQDHGLPTIERGPQCTWTSSHNVVPQHELTLHHVADLLAGRARLHGRVLGRSPQRPNGIQWTYQNVRTWSMRGLSSVTADAVATLLFVGPEDLWPDWHQVHNDYERSVTRRRKVAA